MLKTQYETFITLTGKPSGLGRGSNMKKVDSALEKYWREMTGPADPAKEIEYLSGIVDQCAKWLSLKSDKELTKKQGIRRKVVPNTLFITRRANITSLANEAIHELYTRLVEQGLMTADFTGRLRFNFHKVNAIGTRGTPQQSPFTRQLKPMGVDYQHERTTYLNSGKTAAISGSGVHATHRNINAIEIPSLKKRQELQAIGAKNVETLTVEDYRILDQLGRTELLSGDVTYLTKDQRMQYMALVGNDGLLYDVHGAVINTDPTVVTAYAMDRYGSLFVKSAEPLNGAMFFNHSSFNAGNDVICAGELIIKNGSLRMIDNNSGHYKPTRDNLFNCLDVLASEGLAHNWAVVNLYLYAVNGGERHRYTASNFLANPNAAATRVF